MKYIAVLLTCHNRKEKTLQCLEALYLNEIPAGYFLDVFLADVGCYIDKGVQVQKNNILLEI
ncbi:MAG: hypothetical protein KBE41_04435 [Lutibacter sp.]|mgnify:CR=1 FL=1|nr:hypothetical protein [Lutibacter sp.]MBP9600730.1 hypothetical protein [Lutibacter sp.]